MKGSPIIKRIHWSFQKKTERLYNLPIFMVSIIFKTLNFFKYSFLFICKMRFINGTTLQGENPSSKTPLFNPFGVLIKHIHSGR